MGVKRKLSDLHRRLKRINRRKAKRKKAKEQNSCNYGTLEPRRVLNAAPVAQADFFYTPQNTVLHITEENGLLSSAFDLEESYFDEEVQKKATEFSTTTAGGSLLAFETGEFFYVPPTDFTGQDSFTYAVDDGLVFSAASTVTISVGTGLTAQTNVSDFVYDNFLNTGILQTTASLGGGLELNYRSDSVPTPIIAVETGLVSGTELPDQIVVTSEIGGVEGDVTVYDTSNLDPNEPLRFVQRVVAPDLATGIHDWTMTVTMQFGSGSLVQEFTGEQTIVNRQQSDFGAGWWLSSLDQLEVVDDGLLLVNSDGQTYLFNEAAPGEFKLASGDHSYSSLQTIQGGYRLVDKWGDERRFNDEGRIVAIKRLNSDTDEFKFDYSATGRLETITDQFGRTWDLRYGPTGQLVSVNDFADRNTDLVIGQDNLLTQIVVANQTSPGYEAPEWNFDYAKIGGRYYLATVLDADGGLTEYDYKLSTRRIRAVVDNGAVTRLYPAVTQGYVGAGEAEVFHSNEMNPRFISVDGQEFRFDADASGSTTYFADSQGNEQFYTYDNYGQLVRHVRIEGGNPSTTLEYGYSNLGDLVLVVDSDGNAQSAEYHASLHKVTRWNIGDADFEVLDSRHYSYDTVGNLISFEDYDGSSWTYQYDSRGNLLQEHKADPDGDGIQEAVLTVYEHDSQISSLITSVTVNGTEFGAYEYDNADRPIYYRTSDGSGARLRYDASDQMINAAHFGIYPDNQIESSAPVSPFPFARQRTISTLGVDRTKSISNSIDPLADGFTWPNHLFELSSELIVDLVDTGGGQRLRMDSLVQNVILGTVVPDSAVPPPPVTNSSSSTTYDWVEYVTMYCDPYGTPYEQDGFYYEQFICIDAVYTICTEIDPCMDEDCDPPPPPPPPPPAPPNRIFFETETVEAEEGVIFEVVVGLDRYNDEIVEANLVSSGEGILGSDYIFSPVSLTFGSFETHKTLAVYHLPDNEEEPLEDYVISFASVTNALVDDPSTFNGAIVDVFDAGGGGRHGR